MKLKVVLAIVWLIVVGGMLAAPFLWEQVFWHHLERQAAQADVVEGQQR
ncbi:MAG: hypothetical protein WC600_17135 [Desulfobaccales bacterium]